MLGLHLLECDLSWTDPKVTNNQLFSKKLCVKPTVYGKAILLPLPLCR